MIQKYSLIRILLGAALFFAVIWIPRIPFAESPYTGHHTFKSDVHLDTIRHLKAEKVFARSDLVTINHPDGQYLPDDGFIFYWPVLFDSLSIENIKIYRVSSTIVTALAAAITAEAAFLSTGSLVSFLLAFLFWGTSPLFAYFNQNFMAEPYLLLGISLLLLGALQLLKNENAAPWCFATGIFLICISKLDGIIVAGVFSALLLFRMRRNFPWKAVLAAFVFAGISWVLIKISLPKSQSVLKDSLLETLKMTLDAYRGYLKDLSIIFNGPRWLITEGTPHWAISLTLLCAALFLKPFTRFLSVILILGMLLRTILLLGFVNAHSYYQFPFLPIFALGAGALGDIFSLNIKNFFITIVLSALTLSGIFYYQSSQVAAWFTGWAPAAIASPEQQELVSYLSKLKARGRCLSLDSWVFPSCPGTYVGNGTYMGYGTRRFAQLCDMRDISFYDYYVGKDELGGEVLSRKASPIFGNSQYFVFRISDLCE